MSKIRPFMNQNIIKVLTGIRRCGKSVMLELIMQELVSQGVDPKQFLVINFESKKYEFPNTVDSIYTVVKEFALRRNRKAYLFFDEIQELDGWEKVINSCLIDFDIDAYITGCLLYTSPSPRDS